MNNVQFLPNNQCRSTIVGADLCVCPFPGTPIERRQSDAFSGSSNHHLFGVPSQPHRLGEHAGSPLHSAGGYIGSPLQCQPASSTEATSRHRRSIRLPGYDYRSPGAYFVTICTQQKECLFGDIVNKALVLNDAGTMVQHSYNELQNKYPDIRCDEFVVMPNHFHCIIVNTGVPHADRQGQQQLGEHAGSPLHTTVQWFKTMTTNTYIRGVRGHGWPSFPGKLWQRNYWEHIVRNEEELYRIREYIRNNPAQWEEDYNYTERPARPPEPWMV